MAGDLKHFISEQNRSSLRLQLNYDEIAKRYGSCGDEEFESVLDITTGRVVKDSLKKFSAIKRFGSSKLAATKRHDDKLREREAGVLQQPKFSNHIELNSSGNTNLSVQSFLTHRDDDQDDNEEGVPVPETVLECVASFLEDPTEQEPSDAETLSSHSTDSDSDGDTTQDDLTMEVSNPRDDRAERNLGRASVPLSTVIPWVGNFHLEQNPYKILISSHSTVSDSDEDTTQDDLTGVGNWYTEEEFTASSQDGSESGSDEDHRQYDDIDGSYSRTPETKEYVKKICDERVDVYKSAYADENNRQKDNSSPSVSERPSIHFNGRELNKDSLNFGSPRENLRNLESRTSRQFDMNQNSKRSSKDEVELAYKIAQDCMRLLDSDSSTSIQSSDSKIRQEKTDKPYRNNSQRDRNRTEQKSVESREKENVVYANIAHVQNMTIPHHNLRVARNHGKTDKSHEIIASRDKEIHKSQRGNKYVDESHQNLNGHQPSINETNSNLDIHERKNIHGKTSQRQQIYTENSTQERKEPFKDSEKFDRNSMKSRQSESNNFGEYHRLNDRNKIIQTIANENNKLRSNGESPHDSENNRQVRSSGVRNRSSESKHRSRHRDQLTKDSTPKLRESTPKLRESTPKLRESTPKLRESNPTLRESNPRLRESNPKQRDSKSKSGQSCNRHLSPDISNMTMKDRNKMDILNERKSKMEQVKHPEYWYQYRNHKGEIEWKAKYAGEKCEQSEIIYENLPPKRAASAAPLSSAGIKCVGKAITPSAEHLAVNTNRDTRKSLDCNKQQSHVQKVWTPDNFNTNREMQRRTPEKHVKGGRGDIRMTPQPKIINQQLMSPIQEKYKVKHKRSECLTVENIDLLNQSFNDSFVNVSQNKSALNASLVTDNKQKISDWLDGLDCTEDSLHKMSFTESDSGHVDASYEQVDFKDKHSHKKEQDLKGNVKKGYVRSERDSFDDSISKPPSKRFKTGNRNTDASVKEMHKLSSGFIAKGNHHMFHERFKGMSKREMKAFLESDESGVSSLVNVKPRSNAQYLEDYSSFPGSPESDLEIVSWDGVGEEPCVYVDQLEGHPDTNLDGVRNDLSPYSNKAMHPNANMDKHRRNQSPHLARGEHARDKHRRDKNQYLDQGEHVSIDKLRRHPNPYLDKGTNTNLDEPKRDQSPYIAKGDHANMELLRSNESPYLAKGDHPSPYLKERGVIKDRENHSIYYCNDRNYPPEDLEIVEWNPDINGAREDSTPYFDHSSPVANQYQPDKSDSSSFVSPNARQSSESVRSRDRSARKAPYSAICRNDKRASSAPSVRREAYPVKRVSSYFGENMNDHPSETINGNHNDEYKVCDRRELPNTVKTLMSPVAKQRAKQANRISNNRSHEHMANENRLCSRQEENYRQQNSNQEHHRYLNDRHNDKILQKESRQTPTKRTTDKSTDTVSLYKYQKGNEQKQDVSMKPVRKKEKYTDTSSLNEYCEEGGHESCSCDDIQDRHENLYESFESANDDDFVSPNVTHQSSIMSPVAKSKVKHSVDVKSPYKRPGQENSPYQLTRTRNEYENNRFRQDSPCTSMAKLKINTPQSRKSIDRRPFAGSENRKCSADLYRRSFQNECSEALNNKKEFKHNFDHDSGVYRQSPVKISAVIPRVDDVISERPVSRLSNETFTIETADNEKENYGESSLISNNQRVKSKKNLFTVVGKNIENNTEARQNTKEDKFRHETKLSKCNLGLETDNCFKLPVSPPVQIRRSNARQSPNVHPEKCKLSKNSNQEEEKRVFVRPEKMTNADIVSHWYKVSAIKKTDFISKRQAAAINSQQNLNIRPENRHVLNQLDYAQSTPVRPGVRLSLNETFSTIMGSEETEMEQDDEVMLIEN